MAKGKYYNLMIVPDGVETPMGIRVRAWLFKLIFVLVTLFLVTLILFFTFYGKILSRAILADRLEHENEELKQYKYKVGILEERMKLTRELVLRISRLAGVEIDIPDLPSDSVVFASLENNGKPAIMNRAINSKPGRPNGLPLQGYMTRGFLDDEDNFHPGIDIAAAMGTPVLATATGVVKVAEMDSTYGLMILIEHEDNVSTLYCHNNELLVEVGKEVLVGGRIALSGNSGESSAPHLHYEIRENNIPVNPLKYINEYEESNQ
jgi:murein DD-endopeptidase MepM/ murein hydrolase activator NlpD